MPANWMQTFTGNKFYFNAPDAVGVNIIDIAVSLCRICRFNGHCKKFYSVANHSIFVCELVGSQQLKLPALLHDAHEAYLGDIIMPLKNTINEGFNNAITELEDAIDKQVGKQYKFDHLLMRSPEVYFADKKALSTEKRDNLNDELDWNLQLPSPHAKQIEILPATTAYTTFMSLFNNFANMSYPITPPDCLQDFTL